MNGHMTVPGYFKNLSWLIVSSVTRISTKILN